MVVETSRFARCIGCDLVLDLGSHAAKPLCEACRRKPIVTEHNYVTWWIRRFGYEVAIELSRQVFPPDG